MRSTAGLLSCGSNLSSSFSSTSPNHSPEVLQQHQDPVTATSIISNNSEVNPFDFTNQNLSSQQLLLQDPHSQHVLCPSDNAPHTQHVICTPDGVDGTLQLPQGCYVDGMLSDKFPIYPILENPPPYSHCFPKTLHIPPSNAPSHVHTSRGHMDEGEMVMTDNPNYEDVRVQSVIAVYTTLLTC